MTLEEYVIKRKREDGINEFDLEKRMENTRICVNYIFEYFNNYLDTRPADEKTAPMRKQGMGSFACWNRLSYSLLWMRSPDHGAEKACREKHEKY